LARHRGRARSPRWIAVRFHPASHLRDGIFPRKLVASPCARITVKMATEAAEEPRFLFGGTHAPFRGWPAPSPSESPRRSQPGRGRSVEVCLRDCLIIDSGLWNFNRGRRSPTN
jgi:hypothetical protein